jgi:hypothetical protein
MLLKILDPYIILFAQAIHDRFPLNQIQFSILFITELQFFVIFCQFTTINMMRLYVLTYIIHEVKYQTLFSII